MNTKLKYLPIITKKHAFEVLVWSVILSSILIWLFNIYGFIAVGVFSIIYGLIMVIVFTRINKRGYLELIEETKLIKVVKLRGIENIDVNKLLRVEVYQAEKSITLTLTQQNYSENFPLSSFWDFEEPKLIPFIEKIKKLNPNVELGSNAESIVKGEMDFQVWSVKLHYSYWAYLYLILGAYFLILILVNVFNLISN